MAEVTTQQRWFTAHAPGMGESWQHFYDSIYEESALNRKTKELIAAATSTLNRCPHCTKGHIKKAQQFGATKEEVTETFMITALISSGAELHWMLDDYENLLGNGSQNDRWFEENSKEMGKDWRSFHDALYEESALDRKTKELIAIAAAETKRCRHCTISHIKGAKKFGASKEEISETIMVAALIASGTQLMWMKEDYENLLGD